ncbi:phycobiliprotein lyase [Sphaerothrix gracilis]|uniref:phycobiliprotein lyase n=1 Tax=Sphaerothrix gracilis TaxID=3151835 RepID=UPI0031FE0C43
MEIVNFFEKLAGSWFSQRTTHYVSTQTSQAGQSDLQMELVDSEDPEVTQLCQQLGAEPQQALLGMRVTQDSQLIGETQRQTSSTFLVLLKPDAEMSGQLLRQESTDFKSPVAGRYTLADEVLTIVTANESLKVEERLWFANPNLRMRTSLLEAADGSSLASFCSEIRRGVTKPPSES